LRALFTLLSLLTFFAPFSVPESSRLFGRITTPSGESFSRKFCFAFSLSPRGPAFVFFFPLSLSPPRVFFFFPGVYSPIPSVVDKRINHSRVTLRLTLSPSLRFFPHLAPHPRRGFFLFSGTGKQSAFPRVVFYDNSSRTTPHTFPEKTSFFLCPAFPVYFFFFFLTHSIVSVFFPVSVFSGSYLFGSPPPLFLFFFFPQNCPLFQPAPDPFSLQDRYYVSPLFHLPLLIVDGFFPSLLLLFFTFLRPNDVSCNTT